MITTICMDTNFFKVLKIVPSQNLVKCVGQSFVVKEHGGELRPKTAHQKWQNGYVSTNDGKIYGIPLRASWVIQV